MQLEGMPQVLFGQIFHTYFRHLSSVKQPPTVLLDDELREYTSLHILGIISES